MDPSPTVEALITAALEKPPEARTTFLEDACAGDDELRRQVAER
jgi:hypothetical protein